MSSTDTVPGATRTIGSASIPDTGLIYPWISKNSAGSSFKTAVGLNAADPSSYNNEFMYGDIIRSNYPLSASITRQKISYPSSSLPPGAGVYNHRFVALRNKLNFYGARSKHYLVSSSLGNKNTQTLNLISIPSIFYGTKIKPGSVCLKFYFTGSIAGELRDINQNGELIQVSSSDASTYNNEVAGVVMYEEGFVLLTGSWSLNSKTMTFSSGGATPPTWVDFAAGANDGNTSTTAGATFHSASYQIDFKGTTDTQVLTMFAHAKKGEVNYSNNPTYIEHGQDKLFITSSAIYQESSDLKVLNFTSSSYGEYNAPFKRSVYISKVAIYDKHKNLIGLATLSSPVLKEEDQDYTFKLKLDI